MVCNTFQTLPSVIEQRPKNQHYHKTLMITTSFCNGESWSRFDAYYREDCEHDDYMSAEDYDRKEYIRSGWMDSHYDRQRW